ncbi:UDP-4-amino-4,6-dideoxy-N-acetyl-beta-L-altrosamine transaminase [Ekhidna sp.]|uniref:UDP-4-amino-4, 6-dideoxy-N-acetyl-beta-L-altrosamine transaminase n=1 Tax=Ekhidna sp. TaxID=2608089 RepID=UPI0032974C8B
MSFDVIPYGKQDIQPEDVDAVVSTLKSNYLTQGPQIAEFENAFSKYVSSKYAIAVANGTAALHLCALSLGVNESSKVITSPITFAASANCIRYCGGEVEFVDIDPKSCLLDINKVRELLESHPAGTYSGIIPIDFSGRAVDLEAFRKLADEHNLWIIEDACHAPGGYFLDSSGTKQNCGNGQYADLAIFSFHPVKHIAAGEGGMITTNNEDLYYRLLKLRTHGITKDSKDFQNDKSTVLGQNTDENEWPEWYMEMQELGYNYRLTDIQAALGKSQLKRAESGLKRRQDIAKEYFKAFENAKFVISQSGSLEGHAYHLYVVEVEDRLGLYKFLREKNIYAQIHYFPTHLMPYYKQFGWKEGDLPNAEQYYRGCLSLPMFPTLTEDELDFIINAVFEYYG